ncbi:MAG TPA: hypothetical protein VGS16_13630 [Candidatus Dormibacteraeota bacterium]|nr:hypothetical protein [Candidatus Dormibacteraeota bacterium]
MPVGAGTRRFVFRKLEATPRIELGMEVLQFAPSLSTECNKGQCEYKSNPVESTRYKGMKGVRQREWQYGLSLGLMVEDQGSGAADQPESNPAEQVEQPITPEQIEQQVTLFGTAPEYEGEELMRGGGADLFKEARFRTNARVTIRLRV